jgi:competence protein ComEC
VQSTPPAPALAVRAPLLLPALAAVGAAWAASRLPCLPIALLVALAAAGIALGRRAGSLLLWLALGAVWAEVRWVGPREAFLSLQPARPVTLAGRVAGCWVVDEDGLSAWLAVDEVRQGKVLRRAAARVRVHLPPPAPASACGGGLRVRGYLRPPRLYRNAGIAEVGSWSLWVKSSTLAEVAGEPDPLSRAAGAARRRLFPPPAADRDPALRPGVRLARALLLGDGAALPPEQREAMRRVGLAHLVAVSGLNVGMVATVFLVLLLRAPRGVRLAGTLVGVLAYSLLVGPLPSLLRAVLMAMVVLGALLLRRLPAALNGLAVSCLLLVLLDPSWVDDLGFQLSVAATAGLLALAAPLRDRIRRLGVFAAPLAVTVAAQLATLPWALASFGRLSPISPLANLVAVPWSALALVVALAWATLRLAIGDAADGLLTALDLLARPLAWLEELPASGWITLPLPAPWWAAWTLAALLASCALLPRPRWSLLARLTATAALVWWCAPAPPPPVPELVMLDVGQGDALVLRDGDATLLVDGGGWRRPGFGGRVLLPALAGLGVRRLDALAVTHPDRDHCGGAVDLVRELPVGQVWAPPAVANTDCGSGLRARGSRYRELAAGDAMRLGRWRLRVLGPERDGEGTDNRRSLVLLAETFGRRLLLTGDLDAAGEAALLRRWGAPALACDLLKVAHHGSAGSTITSFLRAADPRLALVSVGSGNAYGHPSPKVLAALDRRRVPLLRTDRDGMVRVVMADPWRIRVTAP